MNQNSHNAHVQFTPRVVVSAIQNCRDEIINVMSFTKGSSEPLYVLHTKNQNTHKYEVISYGKMRVKDRVKDIKEAQRTGNLSFQQENELKKITLLIMVCISECQIDMVDKVLTIDGKIISSSEDVDVLSLF